MIRYNISHGTYIATVALVAVAGPGISHTLISGVLYEVTQAGVGHSVGATECVSTAHRIGLRCHCEWEIQQDSYIMQ